MTRTGWSQTTPNTATPSTRIATKPLLDRSRLELYPPGSAFKVITTAAALESGTANAQTLFDDVQELALPGSLSTISNFNDSLCNGGEPVTLEVAFARSCNTVFGALGLAMEPDTLVEMAEAFGFQPGNPA